MNEQNSEAAKWPIIINQSLADSEIYRLLQQEGYKLRVSNGSLANTCIYPLSSVAFLLLLLQEAVNEWQAKGLKGLTSRILKFIEMHKHCYVLASAPIHGKQEQKLLTALQKQLLSKNISFIPVHNSADCVESMVTIAKVTCMPLCSVVRERFDYMLSKQLTEDTILFIIAQTGMNEHECMVLLDGRSSLAGIAGSRFDQLLDSSISTRSANTLTEFFHQNGYL